MRVLLLSLRAGAGHIRAADAIGQALQDGGTQPEVRHIEVLEHTTTVFRRSFTSFYGSLITRFPSLWRMLYENTEQQHENARLKRFSAFVNRLNSKSLQREVANFDPDAVVCTHFVPAQIMAAKKRKGLLRAKLFVVLTDYDVHTMWLHAGVDRYFCATSEMAYALEGLGVERSRISVSGIPVFRQFDGELARREDMRLKLELHPQRPTVLVSGGGCGLGELEQVVESLAQHHPQGQFLAIAGNNARLRAQLEHLAQKYPGSVRAFGYVQNMHELMIASDFAITKPGGLTVSECLALGLPMILVNPIPGQEERNCSVLLEYGAALSAQSLLHLEYKTGRLLNDEALLQRMSSAARQLSKPRAAQWIARTVFDDCRELAAARTPQLAEV
jgi:processive 1,2-diacylglycerol beta-glucosyltransferase